MRTFILTLIVCLSSAPVAKAGLIWNLDKSLSGDTLDGTPPWLSVSMEVLDFGLLATLDAGGLEDGYFVDELYFNFADDGEAFNVILAPLSGPLPLENFVFPDLFFVDPSLGSFDGKIGWYEPEFLTSGAKAEMFLFHIFDPLAPEQFDVLDATGTATWAARVNSLSGDTALIYSGPGTTAAVPEPSSLTLALVAGAAGLAHAARKRRRLRAA